MDTLIAASLVLILTTISFAILAERQRRRATLAQSELLKLVSENARIVREGQLRWAEGYSTGLVEGNQRGVSESGLSYQKGHEDGWAAAVEALESCRELGTTARAA